MKRSLVPFFSTLAALGVLAFASTASAQEAGDDHEQVVGKFGVGYFGISSLPVMSGAGTGEGSIQAPVIGMRYWMMQKLGIDAGVGFNASNNGWGFAIHGGLPIALATAKHMTFEVVPEATVGFAGNSQGNVTDSGLRLDIGARIGGEIQFGFIGIPQLALQAGVGVYMEHDSWSWSSNNQSGSQSSTVFTTSVGSNPWGVFTDNVSALYYF
jgi:hypothetical protein